MLAGGVSLFAVQLEHALKPRLANRADARVAQVLADHQAERRLSFDATRGQARDALHARVLRVCREQQIGPAGARREGLHSQAQLVGQDDFLQSSATQQRLELVAHGRQRQCVKTHNS